MPDVPPPVQQDTPKPEDHTPPPGETTLSDEKLVPVSEAIRYRKRAQSAEQQLTALSAQLQSLQQELGETRETVSHLERQQKIDALLADAEAVDLETARLLTEQVVQQMDEPDVRMAVDDLRRHKPYLFRQRVSHGHGVMTARTEAGPALEIEHAAERAADTGNRRDLLQYLRLRRK